MHARKSGRRKPPLVVIVGPTASGKSALALELAAEFHGEIISADSRQIYRGMDIGTAKVLPEEQTKVPHHMLDIAKPTETLTLAEYQARATRAVEHIQDRGLLPFLVGGTGLYVRAVVDDLKIPPVPPQAALRKELEGLEPAALADRLKAVDPVGFEEIDKANPRRLIRAIEVSETSGVPFSEMKRPGEEKYESIWFGIALEPKTLENRIRDRVDNWLQRGFLDEIQRLKDDGVSWERFDSFGLHYRAFAAHLKGETSFDEAKRVSIVENIRYAKRQMTWWKKEQRIHWVRTEDEAEEFLSDWLVERAGGDR